MMKNDLENFKIKVFNILKSKDELKNLDYKVDLSKNKNRFNFYNGIYLGFDEKIYVYYKEKGVLNSSVYGIKYYLNYESTFRQFDELEDAFSYIEYLENLIKFKLLEQYFYFEYKSKSTKLAICEEFSLKIVNNTSVDNYGARIDISGLDCFITICFFAAYNFEVSFTPLDENWSKNKRKIYNHIDDLFVELETFTSYDLIEIEETERDMW
ncbi:hypothetical protein GKZ90_0022295 [Flavobacterium sp. MC2016-06]|uniref:hypothetical protein n=1 Tax=Flavobacterium sp. MC2016-06 TaxID=2676308 RepID=UPI0012BA70EA|nr:hypothetical protein [Flavobacterium sp. MC2016-06]MBU3861267.1 hypothetical protein [Flavobacterium sp. MC2016-06]